MTKKTQEQLDKEQRARDDLLLEVARGVQLLLMNPVIGIKGHFSVSNMSNNAYQSGRIKANADYFQIVLGLPD